MSGVWLVGLGATVTLFALVGRSPLGRQGLMTAGAQLLLFATLPPLIAFALFFCLDHSMHHVLELASRFDSTRGARGVARFLQAAAPATAVTVVGALGAALLLRAAGGAFEPSIARVLFIGLAALTVPHMLVTALAAGEVRGSGGRAAS
jgi:Brp/Blh family beta-carotene 15,15'-monooxygenase